MMKLRRGNDLPISLPVKIGVQNSQIPKEMIHEQGAIKYREFLEKFLEQGYTFCFFHELKDYPKNAILLRHDIDFDCGLAWRMAEIEKELNIRASYFFFVSGQGYDVSDEGNLQCIREINDRGHRISLHYDPRPYSDIDEGLKGELKKFASIFAETPSIISLHKPREFLAHDRPIGGVEHTYQSRYFREIKYFSDSTGNWRFGHPFDSPEFGNKMNMQLLVHPIWWLKEKGSKLYTFNQK